MNSFWSIRQEKKRNEKNTNTQQAELLTYFYPDRLSEAETNAAQRYWSAARKSTSPDFTNHLKNP
jgi:glutaredoxin 2